MTEIFLAAGLPIAAAAAAFFFCATAHAGGLHLALNRRCFFSPAALI